VLGHKHYSSIITLFPSHTRSCSDCLVILWRLKLRTLTYNCKITTILIILLMVPFTTYNPAMASHPYWTIVIDDPLSFDAIA
jgi:hypothetical protein